MKEITQEKLKEELKYNPNTGVFIRTKKTSNKVNIGDIVGYKNNCGYIVIGVDGRQMLAHRLAWVYVYGTMPNNIDHINGITDDNRITNLRSVSHQENHKNQAISKNNTSGVTGVYWVNQQSNWLAKIKVNYKDITLGRFDTKQEAALARLKAEVKYGFHKNHGRNKETF